MRRRTMREVVADLRSENAEALLELYEFEYAMGEVRRNLELLVASLQELQPRVAWLATDSHSPTDSAKRVVESATFVAERAEQIAGAFREFCKGLNGWGITNADDERRLEL